MVPFLLSVYLSGMLSTPSPAIAGQLAVSLCATILITEGSRYLVYGSRRWFPQRWRILNVFLIGIAGTTLVLAASFLFRQVLSDESLGPHRMMDAKVIINGKEIGISILGYSFMNALINFPLMLLAWELLYRSALLRHTEKENTKLEKEKLSAELSQLKGIINPHFLFNNLNSLSSLIEEDPGKAQSFLDELTKVFRYLLRNNQTELTTLAEELKFIQTYYQLLRTRYGAGIHLQITIDSLYEQLLIPPLTLQLLIENAVKHNRVQKENPVRIELKDAPGNLLIVRNTVLPKEGRSESTGLGLYSINARYKILNRPGLVIEKNEKEFSVSIPLIEPGN